MDEPKTYNLNAGEVIPECNDGKEHMWVKMVWPAASGSGWHVYKCAKCGIIVEYDTSD